jgi:hypothetical protein
MSGKRSRKRRAAAESPAAAAGPPKRRYRWVLRLAALPVAALALALWLAREQTKEGLTIENRAGQPIATLEVTVAGRVSTFRGVPAGADVTAPPGDEPDRRFRVEGKLADGSMIRGSGVYDPRTHFVVRPVDQPPGPQQGR